MKRIVLGDIFVYEKGGDDSSVVIRDTNTKKYVVVPKELLFRLGVGLITMADGMALDITTEEGVVTIKADRKVKEIKLKSGQTFMTEFQPDEGGDEDDEIIMPF